MIICIRDSNQECVKVYSVSTGACVSQVDFSSPISTFAASSLKEEAPNHMVCGLKDGSVKFLKVCKTKFAHVTVAQDQPCTS